MTPREMLTVFLTKFNIEYLNIETLIPYLITCPHMNFDVGVDDNTGEIVAGAIWLSFMEQSFAVIAAMEGPYEEEWNEYENVYAPFDFEGAVKLADGWYGHGENLQRDASTALYLYYGWCLGVSDPCSDDMFLEKAVQLKEGI